MRLSAPSLRPGCQADGRRRLRPVARSIAKHPPTCSCRACNGTARRFRGEQRGQLAGVPCEFHRERAGIAEAVLSRARWRPFAVPLAGPSGVRNASTVLDLACGSGPMSRELALPGRTVIGLDLSEHELALAADRGPSHGFGPMGCSSRSKTSALMSLPAQWAWCSPTAVRVVEEVAVLRPAECWPRSPRKRGPRPARPQGAHPDQWIAEPSPSFLGPWS